MTRPEQTRGVGLAEHASSEVSVAVPVRRTRLWSFGVGVAAAFLSMLAAAALAGSLLLLPAATDGAVLIICFGVVWFALFFLSFPRQKLYARSLDARRPGARLAGGRLTVPLADDTELCFDLDEPHALAFGWLEIVTTSAGGPTTNTRGMLTYAVLSQAGRELLLQAEDSVSEAQGAGWPNETSTATPALSVRLWAKDLVTLVEAARSHARSAAARPQTSMDPTDAASAPEPPVREWPENPLPARNRNEVSLFLDWLKVELLSRAPAEGGEVCVGRVRGVAPEAAPDTYRFAFSLLEPDPADESDLGSGVSRIFDPSELMLLLSRMEREGQFGPGGLDACADAAHMLTHRTTREVDVLRRAHARGLALIEQLTRFAGPEGRLEEESVKGLAQRTWFRGARERFDPSALEARRQRLGERLRLLQIPAADAAGADRQAALVRELRGRCPEYLAELRAAGFEDAHLRHPLFSHPYHLARFAARALRDGKPEAARSAFAAWEAAEPSVLLFPAREFADAVHELGLDPTAAAAFVPPTQRHTFSSHHNALLEPDYNPWSY